MKLKLKNLLFVLFAALGGSVSSACPSGGSYFKQRGADLGFCDSQSQHAKETQSEAIAPTNVQHDTAVWVDTLWSRAARAQVAQRYDESLSWLDSLGPFLLLGTDSAALVKYFAWRGISYYWLNQVENAVRAYRAAITLQPKKPQWDLFVAYGSLGVIYSSFQYDQEALRNFQKADSVLVSRGNTNGRSFLYLNMAEIYIRYENYRAALWACYDALLYMQNRYVDLIANIHQNMALCYAQMGRKDLVKAHADFALNFVKAKGSESLLQEIYILLAKVWQDCGEVSKAHSLLQAEKALALDRPRDDLYLDLLKTTADGQAAAGNYKAAQRTLDAYIRFGDSTGRLLSQVNFVEAATTDAMLLMRNWHQQQLDKIEAGHHGRQRIYRSVALLLVGVFVILFGVWLTMRVIQAQRVQALANIRAVADRISVVNTSIEHRQKQLVLQQEAIAQQRMALELSQKMLRHFGQKLRKDLRYVSNLQNSLLPSHERLRSVFGDFFALYLPRDVVSGDFYSYAEVGNAKILAVFDCAGHGIPGALMSFIGNILMRRILQEERQTDPAQILTRLHQMVKHYLHDENDCVVGFYTMDVSVAAWFADDHKLVLSNACRAAYLYTQGEMRAFRGVSMSVGSLLIEREYFNDEIILTAPATLYLSSDGFADQMDKNNRKYGSARFVKLLTEVVDLPMQQQLARLRSEFEQYRGATAPTDDVCVLGVRLGGNWA